MFTAVLSIDGGGMKGIISAVILEKLEDLLKDYSGDSNARIGDYFDLIGGTSTGSILTALLLTPENGHPRYSATEILNFYLQLGPYIFQNQSLYPLFGSKYTSQGLQKLLDDFFGTLRISELLKPCLITSYDTTSRKAVFFNKVTGEEHPSRNPLVSEAVRASCSAPTYFPPVCLSTTPECQNCYVDGGVVANNPSICALIEAMKLEKCKSVHDIHLLSIGNVKNDVAYQYRDVKKWGPLEWAVPLFSILLNSNSQTVDYQLNTVYNIIDKPHQYLRLQTSALDKPPAMDDFDKKSIHYFLTAGEELIETYLPQIEQFAQWLIMRRSV